MYCKFKETLTVCLDEDSKVPEAVAYFRRHDPDEDTCDVRDVPVPSKIVICDACSGKGSSSAYLGAFSGERLAEARADDEFWEDYMSGKLDRPCETCGGAGRVFVPDEDRCSPELLAAIEEQDAEDYTDAQTNRMERLMEGGWREEGWFD